MATDEIGELHGAMRRICAALPEVTERPSHGTPTWFVRDKKSFAMLWPTGHHDNAFAHLWLAAPPGEQEALVASRPEVFFRPPYVGHRGWIGVRLDGTVDWTEIAELSTEAFRAVAPPRLAAQVPEPPGPDHPTPGNRTSGNRAPGNRTSGNRTPGNRTPGNRTPGNRTA